MPMCLPVFKGLNKYAWAAVLWMAVIFIFSADEGSGERSFLIVRFIEWLCGALHLGVPSDKDMLVIHILLRKLAHMTEFGVLCFLWRKGGLRLWQAAAVSLLYAVSDEWHQSFVPNRCGCTSDVIIDGSGVLIAVLLIKLPSLWRGEDNKGEAELP